MTTVYGIKNCDTVKKALKWLDSNNIDYSFHDFRADGLDTAQVKKWLGEIPLDKLVNKRSTTWRQLDEETQNSLSEKSAPELLVNNPTLIKRPVLDTGNEVVNGFKEEIYKELLL